MKLKFLSIVISIMLFSMIVGFTNASPGDEQTYGPSYNSSGNTSLSNINYENITMENTTLSKNSICDIHTNYNESNMNINNSINYNNTNNEKRETYTNNSNVEFNNNISSNYQNITYIEKISVTHIESSNPRLQKISNNIKKNLPKEEEVTETLLNSNVQNVHDIETIINENHWYADRYEVTFSCMSDHGKNIKTKPLTFDVIYLDQPNGKGGYGRYGVFADSKDLYKVDPQPFGYGHKLTISGMKNGYKSFTSPVYTASISASIMGSTIKEETIDIINESTQTPTQAPEAPIQYFVTAVKDPTNNTQTMNSSTNPNFDRYNDAGLWGHITSTIYNICFKIEHLSIQNLTINNYNGGK